MYDYENEYRNTKENNNKGDEYDDIRGSFNDTTMTNDQTMMLSFTVNEDPRKNNEENKTTDERSNKGE